MGLSPCACSPHPGTMNGRASRPIRCSPGSPQVPCQLTNDRSQRVDRTSVAYGNGVAALTKPVADQAALRGTLTRAWDANVMLIAVHRMEVGH
jgi:hypothetical protein